MDLSVYRKKTENVRLKRKESTGKEEEFVDSNTIAWANSKSLESSSSTK